jgi:hypothetical protein
MAAISKDRLRKEVEDTVRGEFEGLLRTLRKECAHGPDGLCGCCGRIRDFVEGRIVDRRRGSPLQTAGRA